MSGRRSRRRDRARPWTEWLRRAVRSHRSSTRHESTSAGRRRRVHDLRGRGDGAFAAKDLLHDAPCLVRVDLGACRWYGASALDYDRNGRHPYVRTLVAYDAGHTTYTGSYLERFWRSWTPSSLAEYLGLNETEAHPLLRRAPPLHAVLPWAREEVMVDLERQRWRERPDYRALVDQGFPPARSCGPKPALFGEERFAALVSVHESIRQRGFWTGERGDPTPADFEPVTGVCLHRGGAVRVMIVNGQHRAASVAAHGLPHLDVLIQETHRGAPAWVDRAAVAAWPLVRNGLFHVRDAVDVFDRVFEARPVSDVRAIR